LFGKGNENISTDQIRQFIAQPDVTNQQILEVALEGRVSVQQIMLAMHGQPGWSVGEVRGFLAAQGLNASDAYWSDVEELISVVQGDKGGHSQMSKVLFGDGNPGVSDRQIRDFVKKVMNSGEASEVASLRILEAAVGHRVSVQQLVDAMRGERGWSDQDISQYLTRYGIKAPDESYWTKLENQPKTIFSDEASLKKAGDVLFGMGNGDISPKEIQDFIGQPGLLRRDMLDTALKNNVSVSQILMAMRGKPGWSASEVRAYLSSVGLKAGDSYWKDIDALLKVMYGNDKRDHHKALTAVFGEGNPKITDVEIRNLLRETKGSGLTPEDMGSQLLDVAIANNVSVPQVLKAMRGENGWTADNLRKYLAAQGLETTDAYWSGVKASLPNNIFDGDKALQDARSTAFGSGNKTLSDADIRAFYDTPRYLNRDSLEAALANGISAEQYIRAMSTSVQWQQHDMSDNLNGVRNYLDIVGLHAPDGYWARMEQMLGVGVLS